MGILMDIAGPKIRVCERMSCEESAIFFANLAYTGGPPLTRKSLTRFPLPRFLAYVRASGGFSR